MGKDEGKISMEVIEFLKEIEIIQRSPLITVLGFRGLFAINQTNLCLNANPQRN